MAGRPDARVRRREGRESAAQRCREAFPTVPVVLGGNGVERLIELELSSEETAALHKSGKDVADMIAELAVGV